MESTVQLYLATRDVAERTGFRGTALMLYDAVSQPATVPDDFDEGTLTPIGEQEAQRLIAENAYKTGNAADHGK